jgi:hypothetical protein
VTTGNLVTPENPSLVDRVLQTFATPASSLNEGIATFYDESSGLWEDVCAQPSRHCPGVADATCLSGEGSDRRWCRGGTPA